MAHSISEIYFYFVNFLEYHACCHFPFTYKGVTYNQCKITCDNKRPWCATQVDVDGKYNGLWTYCDENCKTGKSVVVASDGNLGT